VLTKEHGLTLLTRNYATGSVIGLHSLTLMPRMQEA
jgi:hypothetical protein